MENRAKAYWRYKYTAFFLGLGILLAYLLIIQASGISPAIKNISHRVSGNFYISLVVYLAIVNLGAYLFTLPVSFYEGFMLEHAFSLSNQDLASWLRDELKKCAVSVPVFLGLLGAFYALGRNIVMWPIAASILWIAFSVIFVKLFPVFIIPLFYKCNTLTDKELSDRTLELAARFGIKVMAVLKIDFSKTTKKSNAALVGWGNTRRVILTDNLVNEFTTDEVIVVVAHEMAHHALKHILKLMLFEAAAMTLFFFMLSRILPGLADTLGASGAFDISIFPAVWIIFLLYNFVLMPVQNGFSRKLERDADIMALRVTALKDDFISMMKKLGEKNLADESPGRLIKFLFYSHPPIKERIGFAEKFQPLFHGSRP